MSWLRGSLPRASYLITLRILLTRMSLVLLSIILILLLTSSSLISIPPILSSPGQADALQVELRPSSNLRLPVHVLPFQRRLLDGLPGHNAQLHTVRDPWVILPDGLPSLLVYLVNMGSLSDFAWLSTGFALMIYLTIHLMVYLGQLNPIQDPRVTPMLKLWNSEL